MRSPLLPGDPVAVAGYRLHSRLGAGGMGQVYLSFTPGGRPIAIKVVRPEFAGDPEFRRRFRREMAAAQLVQGLYTAAVLDGDPDAPVPWLATAYVSGPSLQWAVAEHGPLPTPGVLRLFAGVAEALDAIHTAGLVHRDLKPANVLLAEDGPRVIDFGIAHAAESTSATRSGVLVGTPMFMAPEQISGDPVTPATDVFALGQLLVYAATGRPAFGEGNRDILFFRILQREPDLDGVPDAIRDVVARCLAKNGADRPTVAELIDLARTWAPELQNTTISWLPAPVATSLRDYEPQAWTPPPGTAPNTATAWAPPTPPWRPGGPPAPGPAGESRAPVLVLSALVAVLFLALLLVIPKLRAPEGVRAGRTTSPSSAEESSPSGQVPSATATPSPPKAKFKNESFSIVGGSCIPLTFTRGVVFTENGPVVHTSGGPESSYDLYYSCHDSRPYLTADKNGAFAKAEEPSFASCSRAMARTPILSVNATTIKRGDRFCVKNVDGTLLSAVQITAVAESDGGYWRGPELTFNATAWPISP